MPIHDDPRLAYTYRSHPRAKAIALPLPWYVRMLSHCRRWTTHAVAGILTALRLSRR
jgi:hypothetical protein